LIQLATQRLQTGLEFIGPQLGDNLVLSNVLPFLYRQAHQHTGHRESEFRPPKGAYSTRKKAHLGLPAGGHHHGLDRPDDFDARRLLRGTAG
jgi:hypothetical protein